LRTSCQCYLFSQYPAAHPRESQPTPTISAVSHTSRRRRKKRAITNISKHYLNISKHDGLLHIIP
jgi:DNA-directed RNA polymerase subunit L